MTPTQRSLKHLRDLGYYPEVVEHWNAFSRRRVDLWGWCDILALRRDEVLAVQATAAAVAARVKKIVGSPILSYAREAGVRIEVHGWRKAANGRYALRVVDLS